MAIIAYLKQRREDRASAASRCAYCRDEFHGRMPGCGGRCQPFSGVPVLPPYVR